ncbi:MAG: alcohol dehydrogenase, partial [Halobacteriaceae archaeon]
QETAHNSIQSLRTRGTHLQLGLTSEAEHGQISIPSDIMTQNELSFVGSRGMPPTEYDELFRLIESGQVRPDNLLTAEVALSDVSSRLQAMTDYQTTGIEVVTDFQN